MKTTSDCDLLSVPVEVSCQVTALCARLRQSACLEFVCQLQTNEALMPQKKRQNRFKNPRRIHRHSL